MSDYFKYKEYSGSIEHSLVDEILHGKIMFIDDLVTYEAETIPQLEKEFNLAVDDYLETCKQLGREPNKSYSGTFNVRVGCSIHKNAVIASMHEDMALNEFVKEAIKAKIDQSNHVVHIHKVIIERQISSGQVITDLSMELREEQEWPNIPVTPELH